MPGGRELAAKSAEKGAAPQTVPGAPVDSALLAEMAAPALECEE